MQKLFFATAEDLLPIFAQVESKHDLAYTEAGLFKSPSLSTVYSGAAISTLHAPAPCPDAACCSCYLITPSTATVNVRVVPQNRGGVRHAVDQAYNADSVIIQHGGIFGRDVLLSGSVSTGSNTLVATRIYRAFASAIGQQFARIQAFYVGPQAHGLLQRGFRLTQGVQCPPEYDLAEEVERHPRLPRLPEALKRLPYIASCRLLIDQQLLAGGEAPPAQERPPRHDDEILGVRFFRAQLADAKLERLTLPRTFFGRSEICNVSFRDTDLSESTANWNDFIDVDFSLADLSRVDLRASVFERVNFSGASLRGADLRHARFTDCAFADADFAGAKLARECESLSGLSSTQRGAIEWHADHGEEPDGG